MTVSTFQVRVWLPDEPERVAPLDPLPFSIGRAADCALTLPFKMVSQRHAEIRLEGDRPVLVDAGSTNGTWLREERLAHGVPYPMPADAEFQIGPCRLRVEPLGTASAPPIVAAGGGDAWARLFADDEEIEVGGRTYVRWRVSGVRSYKVAGVPQSLVSGSMEVAPIGDTICRLEATAQDGTSLTREIAIKVRGRSAAEQLEDERAVQWSSIDEAIGLEPGDRSRLERYLPAIYHKPISEEHRRPGPADGSGANGAAANLVVHEPGSTGDRGANSVPAGDQSRANGAAPEAHATTRWLRMAEGILTPIEQLIDHFSLFLDPRTAPASFLPELARWFGLDFTDRWSEAARRELLRSAPDLFARRGTVVGLAKHLKIFTGYEPRIDDRVPNQRALVLVDVRVPKEWCEPREAFDRAQADVEAIIEFHRPAHVAWQLRITPEPPA